MDAICQRSDRYGNVNISYDAAYILPNPSFLQNNRREREKEKEKLFEKEMQQWSRDKIVCLALSVRAARTDRVYLREPMSCEY